MTTLPTLPRAAWPRHPRFPSQTLLLGSHANFRRLADRLADDVEEPARVRDASRWFGRWMAAMASHERYEEHKLYPYLARRWGASMDALRDGHEELGARKRAVYAALERARTPAAAASEAPRLRRAVDAFRSTLRTHLDLEEEVVIPLLLELAPEEFERYTRSPISALLRELGAR